MISRKFLLTALWILLIFSCKDDELKPVDDNDELVLEEGEFAVSGVLEITDVADLSSLKIRSTSGVYPIDNTGRFEAARNDLEKQFLFAVDQNNEVLLASIVGNGPVELSSASTAEALLAMLPITSSFSSEQLYNFIEALREYDAYDALVAAVRASVASGTSPLANTAVQSSFQQLLGKLESGSGPGRLKDLVEVDHLVEPRIDYISDQLMIRNDGTTTAAWAVEILQRGTSITGPLVIPGNEIKFPGLSSIWSAFQGDFTDAVLSEGDTVIIPLTANGKYGVRFGSPTSGNVLSELSLEALRYNIGLSFVTAWNAFGLPGLKASDYLRIYECEKEPIDAATDVIVDAIHADQLTGELMLDQVATVFTAAVDMVANCTELFNDFPGSKPSAMGNYVSKLSKFLDFYSRAEAAFVLGKRVGDMLVLPDIEVCRQIINGQIFPCFSLVKNNEYDSATFLGETIPIEVRTKLDVVSQNITAYPVGAVINWRITAGEGVLDASSSTVESGGSARTRYRPGKTGLHVITAYVEQNDGAIIDKVDYFYYVDDYHVLSAEINGIFWQADEAYHVLQKGNYGIGTPDFYTLYVSSRRIVDIGQIAEVWITFEPHFEPYDFVVGYYPLGNDNNINQFSNFLLGGGVSTYLGGNGYSGSYGRTVDGGVTITSITDNFIEGTFTFLITENGKPPELDRVLYDVRNGYFKIKR